MPEIQGMQGPTSLLHMMTDGSDAQVKEQHGILGGNEVVVQKDEQSKLADAAEEMTFARDNSRKVKLSDRKQSGPAKTQTEKAKSLSQKMKSSTDNKKKSEKLKSRAQQPDTDEEDLEDEALQLFIEPAEAFAALQEGAENAQSDEERELFKKAAANVLKDHGSRVNALLNALDDSEKAQNATGQDALQNARNYTEIVCNFTQARQMLDFMTKSYGDKVEEGLNFMYRALGADLESSNPSHERALLISVGNSLDFARMLNSSLKQVQDLLNRLDKVHGLNTTGAKQTDVLNRLVNFADSKFIAPLEIRNLVSEVKTQDPEQEVLLTQELLKMLRDCPDSLFSGNANRASVMEAAQRLVDEKIALEDEWLAKM